MKKGNLAAAAAFAALAVFVLWQSGSFPPSKGGVPGPAVFPAAIAVVMLMAAISLAITTLRARSEDDAPLDLGAPDCLRVYLCMAILAVYVLVMPLVGFCVTSSLLLFGLIQWFGRYKFHISALAAIAITGIVYLTFSELLRVPFRFGFLI
ncbi:MAG: tripartite tricarboxylate transporter TctB family protein [Planctomycetota bacterium]|jgi:putative tricarboxylic transport membrane protein|nr:tripartite tricarboxylate transporter TctB family protein [Planctomycetota bacterium]